jgi:hypothetical protein
MSIPFRASSAKGRGKSFPIGTSTEGQAMMNSATERHIGETMAVVLRERLVELETLEAIGAATEETVGRLAFAIILGVGPFLVENKGFLSLPRMRSRQIQSRYEHTIYAKIAHRKRSPTPAG